MCIRDRAQGLSRQGGIDRLVAVGVDKREGGEAEGDKDGHGGGGARGCETIRSQVETPMRGKCSVAHADEMAHDGMRPAPARGA